MAGKGGRQESAGLSMDSDASSRTSSQLPEAPSPAVVGGKGGWARPIRGSMSDASDDGSLPELALTDSGDSQESEQHELQGRPLAGGKGGQLRQGKGGTSQDDSLPAGASLPTAGDDDLLPGALARYSDDSQDSDERDEMRQERPVGGGKGGQLRRSHSDDASLPELLSRDGDHSDDDSPPELLSRDGDESQESEDYGRSQQGRPVAGGGGGQGRRGRGSMPLDIEDGVEDGSLPELVLTDSAESEGSDKGRVAGGKGGRLQRAKSDGSEDGSLTEVVLSDSGESTESAEGERMRLFIGIAVTAAVQEAAGDVVDSFCEEFPSVAASVVWVAPPLMHITVRFLGEAASSKIDFLDEAIPAAISAWKPFDMRLARGDYFGDKRRGRRGIAKKVSTRGGKPRVLFLSPLEEEVDDDEDEDDGDSATSSSAGEVDQFRGLAAAVADACADGGFKREDAQAHAHVTLGRARRPKRRARKRRRAVSEELSEDADANVSAEDDDASVVADGNTSKVTATAKELKALADGLAALRIHPPLLVPVDELVLFRSHVVDGERRYDPLRRWPLGGSSAKCRGGAMAAAANVGITSAAASLVVASSRHLRPHGG